MNKELLEALEIFEKERENREGQAYYSNAG